MSIAQFLHLIATLLGLAKMWWHQIQATPQTPLDLCFLALAFCLRASLPGGEGRVALQLDVDVRSSTGRLHEERATISQISSTFMRYCLY